MMRALVLGLLLAIPLPGLALALGGIATPTTTRAQRGPTCTSVAGVGLRCSDGRVSGTQRASAVPCGGGYAAANVACVENGRVQAWGATTNHWPNSTTPSSWLTASGATASGSVVSATSSSSRAYVNITPAAGTWTASCLLRSGTSNQHNMRVYQEGGTGGGFCPFSTTSEFTRHSCTHTLTGTLTLLNAMLYPTVAATPVGNVDVQGCWLTPTATPGRPCWQASGAAPFTCAADVHTISTAGWPTTEGSIRIAFSVATVPTITATILDGRTAIGTGQALYLDTSSRLVWVSSGGAIFTGPVVALGDHVAEVKRAGGTDTILLDGVAVGSIPAAPNWTWKAASVLGSGFAATGTNPFNGSLRTLAWSAR